MSASPEPVRIDAGRYLLRTLNEDDASDRWAEWPADPEAARLLNAPTRRLTKSEVVDYIRSFDQRSRLLLGIFDKENGAHIGFVTFSIDFAASRCLANMLIGERDYRNRGALTVIRGPLAEYLFETLGLQTMLASVLAHNRVVLDTLRKKGWVIEKTLPQHVKSHAGDKMLDLCLLRLSREKWRAQKLAGSGRDHEA